jgi:poly-gamma-glutamate capsule biosynthesis protein CapA/YwtB (metallophosphatase superfamily)
VEVIIGGHSHQASQMEGTRKSCRFYSLRNFLFDQDKPQVSGMLLEAVFFPQGTYFLKIHPIKNLYRLPLSPDKLTAGVNPVIELLPTP